MRIYSVIDTFGDSLGEGSVDSWVAHFTNKEDAVKCAVALLGHYGITFTEKDFDECISTDSGFSYMTGSDTGVLFVKHTDLNESYEPSILPF